MTTENKDTRTFIVTRAEWRERAWTAFGYGCCVGLGLALIIIHIVNLI
jgi:hypothetical protein